jgi:hypothetical protein
MQVGTTASGSALSALMTTTCCLVAGSVQRGSQGAAHTVSATASSVTCAVAAQSGARDDSLQLLPNARLALAAAAVIVSVGYNNSWTVQQACTQH